MRDYENPAKTGEYGSDGEEMRLGQNDRISNAQDIYQNFASSGVGV
jgi:hypothetical protein